MNEALWIALWQEEHYGQYMAKSDARLIESARSIFGQGIVLDAFIVGTKSDKIRNKTAEDRVESALREENNISFDGEIIVILFSSGNYVKFLSSEWGSVSRIDPCSLDSASD